LHFVLHIGGGHSFVFVSVTVSFFVVTSVFVVGTVVTTVVTTVVGTVFVVISVFVVGLQTGQPGRAATHTAHSSTTTDVSFILQKYVD
jgi:hypothetical protein